MRRWRYLVGALTAVTGTALAALWLVSYLAPGQIVLDRAAYPAQPAGYPALRADVSVIAGWVDRAQWRLCSARGSVCLDGFRWQLPFLEPDALRACKVEFPSGVRVSVEHLAAIDSIPQGSAGARWGGFFYLRDGNPLTGSGQIVAVLPIWSVLCVAMLPLIMLSPRLLRSNVVEHRCERCGYNLTGNVSGSCPECGVSVIQ